MTESAKKEKQVAAPQRRRPTFNPTSFSRAIPNYLSTPRLASPIPKILREQADTDGAYYLYNKLGHRARDYPTKTKGGVRVHEIDDDDTTAGEEADESEYESSSEN